MNKCKPPKIATLLIATFMSGALAGCFSSDSNNANTHDTPVDNIIPASCLPLMAESVVDTDWQVESYDNYEFEVAFDESLEKGAIIGNAPTLQNDGDGELSLDPASNGQYVYMNGNSGKLYLHNISIPEDGVYEFKIHANTQPGYKKQHIFLYKDGQLDHTNLQDDQHENAAFSQWGYEFLEHADPQWHEFIMRPELEAGNYSMEIRLSWGYTIFDQLEVSSSPIRFASQYALTQGVHYTKEMNPISAELKLNTNKLVGVSIGGEPASYTLNDECNQLTISADGLSQLEPGSYQAQVDFDYMEPTIFEIKVIEDENLTGPAGDRYEAEDVTLGELMKVRSYGDSDWDTLDDAASGGKYVSMENSGNLLFYVNVAQAGLYNVSFRYRTGSSDKAQDIKVNDEFALPGAGFRSSRTYWETANFPMEFKEGSNKIEIIKSWGYQDFDYFDVSREPVAMAAKIGPKQQSFYLDKPKQLSIKVDPYGNQLTQVTISGLAEDSEVQDAELQYEVEEYKDDIEGRFTSVIYGGFFAHLSSQQLADLAPGDYEISWQLSNGDIQKTQLAIVSKQEPVNNDFVVIFFDSSHGNAAAFLMPSGKTLIVDLGQWWVNLDRVIPFLKANNIEPDYLWLTHPHGDHIAGTYRRQVYDGFISDGHEAFVNTFPNVMVQRSMHEEDGGDRNFFSSGREFEFEGTNVKILNTFGDSCSEDAIAVNSCDLNANSLAFSMNYQDFTVQFQGDIYAHNQDRIMREYGLGAITGQVLYGNHHWHGSINPEYVKNVDPSLIFVPASEVVYARGAFTQDAMEAVNFLRRHGSRYKEMLMSFDIGHLIIRATSNDDGEVEWTYETMKDLAIDEVGDLRYPDYSDSQQQALHQKVYLPNLDKWRSVAE
jgi:beta-lactamase superfamily II metal-dependent hydrolase